MKLTDDSAKTNWKFIAIVVAFGFGAIGGILLLRTMEPAPSPTPTAQKSISLTTPQGAEQWEVGSRHSITWNSVGVETVRISPAVGGKGLATSEEIDASLGMYENFVVPDMSGFGIEPPYEVTIMIFDAQDPNVLDKITFTAIEPFDTSGWQTYRNEEFGFEMKYPPELSLKERKSSLHFRNDALGIIIFLDILDNPQLLNLYDYIINEYGKNGPLIYKDLTQNAWVQWVNEKRGNIDIWTFGLRPNREGFERDTFLQDARKLNRIVLIRLNTTKESSIDNENIYTQILATFRFVP